MRIRQITLRNFERLIVALEILILVGASTPRIARAQVTSLPASPVIEAPAIALTPMARRVLPEIGPRPRRPAKRTLWMTATAYSSTVDQTDSDPFTTASGAKVRDGIVAWNDAPFGTTLRLPSHFGDKIFVVQDRLNARASKYHVDLWMPTREAATQWGARLVKVEIL